VPILLICLFAEMPGNVPAPSQVFVRCSDPNVICTSDVVQHGEPHDVVFKVCFLLTVDVVGFQSAKVLSGTILAKLHSLNYFQS